MHRTRTLATGASVRLVQVLQLTVLAMTVLSIMLMAWVGAQEYILVALSQPRESDDEEDLQVEAEGHKGYSLFKGRLVRIAPVLCPQPLGSTLVAQHLKTT